LKQVLTIAGSDSSGGAGIQADLKTFAALGTYGMSVITAVTAQNTQGVHRIEEISRETVKAQIDAVFSDIRVDAVKIGMVYSVGVIEQIAASLRQWGAGNIVVDPVMAAKSGHRLLRPDAIKALTEQLFPLAAVITPNLPEAGILLGTEVGGEEEMEPAAARLFRLGPRGVLLKGGHLAGPASDLFYDGVKYYRFSCRRIENKNTHGTGCTLSAAIAAYLALGLEPAIAVAKAKDYLTGAIEHGFTLGKGVGPLQHFYKKFTQPGS